MGVFDSILGILQPKPFANFLSHKESNKIEVDNNYAHIIAHDENINKLHSNIKEYATLKHIIEINSDYINMGEDG